jgi:hypothetical protein
MRRGNWQKAGRAALVAGLVVAPAFAAPAGAEPPDGSRAAATREESPELQTDRPDFTETAVVVPRGSLQVESGFTWERRHRARSFDAPELLLRAGLLRRTELRLELPGYSRVTGAGRAAGFSDGAVGFKQQLGPTASGFEVALIPVVSLPTGASSLTSGAPDPAIGLAWARDLGPGWSLGGLFDFSWPTEADGRNPTTFATLSLGRELGGPWGAFLEYAAEIPHRGGGSHLLHHGYTYALGTQAQLDLHLGVGLSAAAPRFFIGAGYSRRYGPRRRAVGGGRRVVTESLPKWKVTYSKPTGQPL